MSGWILALPRADMEHCIKIGVFGMNRKWILDKVQVGDPIVCYVTKECKIIGVGKCTEPYYVDDSDIFLRKGGAFIDRIGFTAKRLKEEPDFKTLIEDLEFIKNKYYWAVFSKSALSRITDNDWKLIAKLTDNQTVST